MKIFFLSASFWTKTVFSILSNFRENKYKDEISFLVDVEENKNHILYGKYLDEEEGIHR